MQSHTIVVTNFYNNYKYVPGDMPSAVPPGTGDGIIGQGPNGANDCALSPYDEYSNMEYFQFWAQLSKSGMISKEYEYYSPEVCDGPHSNTYFSQSNAGISWAYTELTGATAAFSGGSKYAVTAFKTSAGTNLFLSYVFDPGWVVPIENKLGTQAYNGSHTQTGLVSVLGVGICTDDENMMPCSSSTALYGQLYNYFSF